MSPLLTLFSSLPFIFVFFTLLLSSYLTPASPPLPSPSLHLPQPSKPLPLAEFLPPPSTPRPHRHRTLSASDLIQPRKLFSTPATTVIANTSACVTIEQAPNDAALPTHGPEQPKAITRETNTKTKKKKKPKTVSFALDNNTTRIVDRWIVKVTFADFYEELEVERWIEPHGRHQRSFPRTTFVRDGPDVEDEDDEGDVVMGDD